jgi:hypothetical protein
MDWKTLLAYITGSVDQEEVWQRSAGKWATCDPGQKPCAIEAQALLILKAFLTSLLE